MSSDMADLVYVVIGSKGEYSDRDEWVAAVFSDKAQAMKTATEKLAASKAALAAYTEYWRRYRAAYAGLASTVLPDANDVREKCGPKPDLTDLTADDYTVVEVPMNTWGKWECVESAEEKP